MKILSPFFEEPAAALLLNLILDGLATGVCLEKKLMLSSLIRCLALWLNHGVLSPDLYDLDKPTSTHAYCAGSDHKTHRNQFQNRLA